MVHGFTGFLLPDIGNFELALSDTGLPSTNAVICRPTWCPDHGGYDAECLTDEGAPGCEFCLLKNQQSAEPNEDNLELKCINVNAIDKQLEKKGCGGDRNGKAACLAPRDTCFACEDIPCLPFSSGTCEDSCGSAVGDCWCDTFCLVLGDCCCDVVDFCPESHCLKE